MLSSVGLLSATQFTGCMFQKVLGHSLVSILQNGIRWDTMVLVREHILRLSMSQYKVLCQMLSATNTSTIHLYTDDILTTTAV